MTGVEWAAVVVTLAVWTVLATVLVGIPVGRALRHLFSDDERNEEEA